MGKHPILHYINEIKNKLGFSRTMTASGADVVDAVNGLSGKISDLHEATFLLPDIVSLTDLKSRLLTIASGMDNHTNKSLGFWISADSSPFAIYATYIGNLHIVAKPQSGGLYFSCDFTSNIGDLVTVGYNNGTWTFKNLTNQIDALGPYNGLDSNSTTAALSAAQGKALNDRMTVVIQVSGTTYPEALRNATISLINRTDLPTYTFLQGFIDWMSNDYIPAIFVKIGAVGRIIAFSPSYLRCTDGTTSNVKVFEVQLTQQ